jgi:hypothetical protein
VNNFPQESLKVNNFPQESLKRSWTASGLMAKATARRGSVTWPGAKTQAGSGRREAGSQLPAGESKAVLDCIGADGEGN